MLGGHQLLFTLPLAPNMAPGFCLRHDVDGLVWQPMGDELEGSWGCQHIATLQALGYIQASKEQRKFTLSPPSEYIYLAIDHSMKCILTWILSRHVVCCYL